MSYLTLENVNKNFGSYQALSNINLSADNGEFVVLLGPSGCGKSTLLGLITGLIEDHDGRILINNRDVTDLDPKDRKVAMVFQSYALYPHLTVAKNISFGMSVRKVAKAEQARKVKEVAESLQLDALLDRYPAQLSGGQRQRVAIARCLVREPDLFLFDEPLSNLDAKLRHETRVELKQLHQRQGTTTIYVTHDQHEAMTLGTKVVLMSQGEIVQYGTPLELYDQPINRFAATFIGSPQINLVPGTLVHKNNGLSFSAGTLDLALTNQPLSNTENLDGRAVEFAIRAESVSLATEAEADVHLQVNYVEATGSDIYVNGLIDEQDVVFRLPKTSRVQAGDQISIKFDMDQSLVFDSESGNRLV